MQHGHLAESKVLMRGDYISSKAIASGEAPGYWWLMRRSLAWSGLCLLVLMATCVSRAATGRVIKVLPLFTDLQGRVAISPSLYDRDAYQVILRDHPEQRSGIRYDIQWKTKGPVWSQLKLRAELRGVAQGNLPKELMLEKNVEPKGRFSHWSELMLTGADYKGLVEVTAWRVTLWEGDQMIGEQKSFLW